MGCLARFLCLLPPVLQESWTEEGLPGPACYEWPWPTRSEQKTWPPCSGALCPSRFDPTVAQEKGFSQNKQTFLYVCVCVCKQCREGCNRNSYRQNTHTACRDRKGSGHAFNSPEGQLSTISYCSQ